MYVVEGASYCRKSKNKKKKWWWWWGTESIVEGPTTRRRRRRRIRRKALEDRLYLTVLFCIIKRVMGSSVGGRNKDDDMMTKRAGDF